VHTPPWVPLTLQARTIDNAEEIKQIIAGAIEQAEGGKCAKAVHRASVRLDRALTVEASSQAITAALYAGLMGIPITRYEVDVGGYLDLRGFYGLVEPEEELTGFTRVMCETRLEADAPADDLERFQRLDGERCIGYGTLRQPVAIESHWQITSTHS
jgi:uncharacterized OsmC-like protein